MVDVPTCANSPLPIAPVADAAPPLQSRVVGGFNCKKNSQPWQVAVYYQKEHICGGVLLDRNWVLTAAHCYNE